jgi:hypothetical protein
MERVIHAFAHLHHAPADWSLDRYAAHALRLAMIAWSVVTAACMVSGVAVGEPQRYFGEFTPYTVYVVFVLGTCAFVCGQNSAVATDRLSGFWKIVCVGCAAMAIDDLTTVHENLDNLVHYLAGADRTDPFTTHLDALIVLGYGLIGLIVVAWWWRDVRRLPWLVPAGTVAGAAFLAMVFFDLRGGRLLGLYGDAAYIAEEALKGLCATLLFWTFVVARQQYRLRIRETTEA